ncbi:MAG: ribonuclease HII [Dehalococcoidia bacterium]|nr:ribonuclease HII [Dehalococcoidia bacterium]
MVVTRPTFSEEKAQWACGYSRVAGVDEAGRGPLAGPVVAAAIILPGELKTGWARQIADSKLVTPLRREYLYYHLREVALGVGVGVIDSATIDMVGIAKATRLAMKQAVKQIDPPPDYLLIDYFKLPEVRLPQNGVIEGDTLCFSIACASVIAKVTRDCLMKELDAVYPGYGFARHKGYSTREHLECLRRLGASPIHRRSFRPVREVCGAEL